MREHVGQPAIGHRTLVDVAAAQADALLAHPGVHLLTGEGLLGRAPTEEATGTMDSGVEARATLFALEPADDDGIIAHRAADKAALAGKGRRGTLADDPQ